MTEKSHDVTIAPTQEMEESNFSCNAFTNKVIRLNALASNDIKQESFNLRNAVNESQNDIKALKANGGLQEMLAAQMLAVHQLQQTSMAMANAPLATDQKQYFTNAAIKLSSCFIQQANLFSRLQGNGGQKMVIEHVTVNSGGQAVVGNITGGCPTATVEK